MPSWLPESWNDNDRWARWTERARRSPTFATCASTWLRSSAVSENSDATDTAVPSVRATTASRPSRATSTVTAGPRPVAPVRARTLLNSGTDPGRRGQRYAGPDGPPAGLGDASEVTRVGGASNGLGWMAMTTARTAATPDLRAAPLGGRRVLSPGRPRGSARRWRARWPAPGPGWRWSPAAPRSWNGSPDELGNGPSRSRPISPTTTPRRRPCTPPPAGSAGWTRWSTRPG